jgi:hypothetical protein
VANGMMRHRRNRQAGSGHAPAREAKRQSDLIPVRGDCFPWRPGELILGPRAPRPNLASDIGARLQALYGRSENDGEA